MKRLDEICGCLYFKSDFRDATGCLKPKAHNDHHICKTEDGKLIAWEDDYSCTCGCWDDYEKGDDEVCMIYWEVDKIN